MQAGGNQGRWAPPEGGPVTSLDVTPDGLVVAAGGAVWRCTGPTCARVEGRDGVIQVAAGDGTVWAVGDGRLDRWTGGAWSRVETGAEPRSVAALSTFTLWTDTDNRLHRVGGEEPAGEGVADLRASKDRVLARRTGDDAVVAGLPWEVVAPGPATLPAGFLADGTPVVIKMRAFEKGGTAPTQDLVTPDGRVIASVTGTEIHVRDGVVGYVELGRDGRATALVRTALQGRH